jgi:DNA-binding NarL/FixJ family response regulator
MPLRVLIAEDHSLVRAGLRALIQKMSGVVVTGEAATGREALELVEREHPDIVLMDLAMPDLNGLEATARLAREHPRVRVIVLSMHSSEEYVRHALKAGAAGYVIKDAGPEELELALRAVGRGETYLSPAVSRRVVEGYVHGPGEDRDPLDRLTPRQREILQRVAEGRSSKEIAQSLGLSVKTVETHRAHIMERLDIHDLAGLVRFAVRTGLVEPH